MAGHPQSHAHSIRDAHEGHHEADFLKKFWIVLMLTIPLVLYSDLPAAFIGWSAPKFSWTDLFVFVTGTVVYVYGGSVFLKGAYREVRESMPGMMTLISLAISAAYLYSAWAIFAEQGMTLFWELSTLIAVMLIGHWVEMRSVRSARGALHELARLLPDEAEVLRDGSAVQVAISELNEADMVLVRPGQKVPADGVVVEGDSDVNESLITGESKPIHKGAEDTVIAGSINGDGSLTIRIEHTGERTFLSSIMRLVAESERSKSRLQLLSDRAAFYLTIAATAAGVVTLIAWLYAGAGAAYSIERLVAVLVIACPHALGLAIPLVASISTTLASKNGFFIKRRLALESARNIDVVLFDKTGTLTEGRFAVTAASDAALAAAAAVEAYSEHPIGRAIIREAEERNIEIPRAEQFKRIAGSGAQATLDGKTVFVGHTGGDDIVVKVDGHILGTIELADTVRQEAREAIDTLKGMGIDVLMITGDSREIATSVAHELGIQNFFARVRPEEKSEKVKILQSEGKKVAMVGDGVNDAPALTQADLGVAIGAGTNVAIESAGIILVRNDPRDIPKIIRLSRLTYRKMIQNLFWATGYNVVALPIAAGALVSKGIILQPAVAAVFMSLSTVIVAINAALLRRKSL